MDTTTTSPRTPTTAPPGGPVRDWQILTSSRCPRYRGTLAQARAHVEGSAPLKRGWTGTWEQHAEHPDRHYYIRRNSRGRVLPGYGILLTTPAGARVRG
jgi:hypothetical protein